MKNKTLIVNAVVLVVGIGIGYFIPHSTLKNGSNNTTFTRTGGTFMMRGGGMGGGALSGTVASKDATSMTIDTRDGSSHVILISPNITVLKSVAGNLSDVAIGSTVLVTGTPNTDGSLAATSIQLRPASSTPPMGR